jgi:hypothetical protein
MWEEHRDMFTDVEESRALREAREQQGMIDRLGLVREFRTSRVVCCDSILY